MRHICHLSVFLVVLLAGCASAPPALPPRVGSTALTRAQLEEQLAGHESALASGSLSREQSARITADADEIRRRLQYGDFRVGDRIALSVQGETVPDTLTVQPGLTVSVGLFGEVPVAGVLRSEIQDHLRRALSAYIRDPVVRATALMRVSVVGAVGQPGFFTMPAETVLGDALMIAGGPGGQANLDQVRIRRGTQEIMDGETVRVALQSGLTLDELNLLGGDQIVVPERRGILALLGIVSGIIGSVGFLFWIFN